MKSCKNVNEYIASFPPEVRKVLKQMRATIRKAAPKAEERMVYGIPTYTGRRNLVHFGGFAKHVSFFPGGSARKQCKELSAYAGGKGTIKFPLDEPIPWALIAKIAKFHVKEDSQKS